MKITDTDDMPFEVVPKEERKSPLKQTKPTQCEHPRAYASDKYPVSDTRYICTECGFGSQWPRDLE